VIGALIAVLSATQDAAADGYAVERLAPGERGIGNAIQGGAVAVGVIAGGAGTLLLYDQIGWQGALTIVGVIALLAALPLALAVAIGRAAQRLHAAVGAISSARAAAAATAMQGREAAAG
jgi:MFS family permease